MTPNNVTMTENQPPFKASDHVADDKFHLLLAATGSVATIKLPNIVTALSHHSRLSIRILVSDSAAKFLQGQSAEQPLLTSLLDIPNVDAIHRNPDEWRKPWIRGDSILHIELRRWADLMVVAPLSANGLAKFALGMSDDLVSSVVRAWDTTGLIDAARMNVPWPYRDESGRGKKGIIVAPSMNTAMWAHPITKKHVAVLEEEWGVGNGGWFEVLKPAEKMLACGDVGAGAMRAWEEIVTVIEQRLGLR